MEFDIGCIGDIDLWKVPEGIHIVSSLQTRRQGWVILWIITSQKNWVDLLDYGQNLLKNLVLPEALPSTQL